MSSSQLKDLKVPLLVRIQTIDVEKLDFRSSVAKNKHVTYVEGTSQFLFVGCTSGTIYVFSRETLQFLFIIPFKGGKVCGISCAEDETDVAVGSLRGNVTIYRLKNVHTNNLQSGVISPPNPIIVKPLYSVSHHRNNEITEIQWSPNGRYVFLGDTQGIISQVDVGSLEEFPRPPPSRVILQVQSRVLQLNCIFPYLAINTLAGVFLCDIENEDFTRIYAPNSRTSLQATGICLVAPTDLVGDDCHSVSLYVACPTSNSIIRYGMQGNLLGVYTIPTAFICPSEVPLFDPKKEIDLRVNTDGVVANDFKSNLGKLYTTDEGYIISASNHRIAVIEPTTGEVNFILWNDDFRRISSVKILSNYLFVWETGKLHVVAITQFQSYGIQLLRANLHTVLENWIRHSLNSVGWRKEDANNHDADEAKKTRSFKESSAVFASMLGLPALPEETELTRFVIEHVPESLREELSNVLKTEVEKVDEEIISTLTPLQEDIYEPSPVQIALKKLASTFTNISEDMNNQSIEVSFAFSKCWKALTSFYLEFDVQLPHSVENTDEDSVIFKQSLFQSKMTLESLIQSAVWFIKQPHLSSLALELQNDEVCVENRALKESVQNLMQKFCGASDGEIAAVMKDELEYADITPLFAKYACQNFVIRWLKEYKISPNQIEADTFIAEMLLLLIPFAHWLDSDSFLELLRMCRRRIFSWLVILVSSKVCQKFPFPPKLGEFLSSKLQGNVIGEIISYIYEDFLSVEQISGPIFFMHHFASLLHFKFSTKSSKSKILSALITHFPVKNRTDEEIKEIVLKVCEGNRMLVQMYKEACLTDGNSQSLCSCGLPDFYGMPRLFMIAKTQRILEEVILEILTGSSSDLKSAFKFAMQRLLLDKYFQIVRCDPEKFPDDRLNLEIVFRSGQCHLLHKYLGFSQSRLRLCIEFYRGLYEDPTGRAKCSNCDHKLKSLPSFRPFSWDCVGLWTLGDSGLKNVDSLLEVLRSSPRLNVPGLFSLRFYRYLVQVSQGESFAEESIDYEMISRSRLNSVSSRCTCVAFQ